MRPSLYSQWGMEARQLVSTGKYRGDTGRLEDLYLIKPRHSKLMEVGMTVEDLATIAAVIVTLAITAYAMGPGIDNCIAVLGW